MVLTFSEKTSVINWNLRFYDFACFNNTINTRAAAIPEVYLEESADLCVDYKKKLTSRSPLQQLSALVILKEKSLPLLPPLW